MNNETHLAPEYRCLSPITVTAYTQRACGDCSACMKRKTDKKWPLPFSIISAWAAGLKAQFEELLKEDDGDFEK